MHKNEIEDILRTITIAYANFTVTQEVLVFWSKRLARADYKKTKSALERHIESSRFIPTLAEIAVYNNSRIEKTKAYLEQDYSKMNCHVNSNIEVNNTSLFEKELKELSEARKRKRRLNTLTDTEIAQKQAEISFKIESMKKGDGEN